MAHDFGSTADEVDVATPEGGANSCAFFAPGRFVERLLVTVYAVAGERSFAMRPRNVARGNSMNSNRAPIDVLVRREPRRRRK